MKKVLISFTLLIFVLSSFAQGIYRDVVHLKNGSVIKGVIVEQVPSKQLKIETSDGSVFVYQMDEIEKMSKEQIDNSRMRNVSKSLSSSSPTAQGRMIVSGSSRFLFSTSTTEVKSNSGYDDWEADIKQFNFKPALGWFVADGLAVALSIDYESSKQGSDKQSTFMFGPSLAYYFGSSNIKPFVQGEYMFGNYERENDSYDSETKMNGWGLGAGVAFFLNQYISLDLGLGYANISGENDDSKDEITTKGTTFGGGISVYF